MKAEGPCSGSPWGTKWRPPLLAILAASLLLGSASGGSFSHFYHITYMGLSQPSQGLPHFMAVAYADGQPIAHYDSDIKKIVPQISWMKKAVEEDPKYFNWYTQILQHDDYNFRGDLVTLGRRYNQSEGFHTVQMMIVCEMKKDGSKGGHWQYGYDGRDFLSFDMETLTWTAADMQAQVIKRMWEKGEILVRRFKAFLEDTCAEWMQKDLDYGKERLLRKEPPTVKMTRKPEYDGMETLICRVYGFYPQEIDATWTKDGEVWVQDTFRGVLAPNSDGTYYIWLGINIIPKERDLYRCHVEHDGLLEPLELTWEEPGFNVGLVVGSVVGAVLIVAVIAGISVYVASNKRSDSSNREELTQPSSSPNAAPSPWERNPEMSTCLNLR